MPAFPGSSYLVPTSTYYALAVNSSEAASLGGKKAQTPIIAGSVCGGVMGLAWIIGFTIYFMKRQRRKKRNRMLAEGKSVPLREKDLKTPEEKIVIPPDPAVLLGHRQPGESAFPDGPPKNERSTSLKAILPHVHKSSASSSSKIRGKSFDKNGSTASILGTSKHLEPEEVGIVDEMTIPPTS